LHQQLGQVYQTQEKYDESYNHFKKALEIDPDYCDVDMNLGTHYIAIGNFGLGVYHFKKM